jgi:hypothetical protein
LDEDEEDGNDGDDEHVGNEEARMIQQLDDGHLR